ncbi:MAG: lipocalin family protein [Cyclobacteriaceae bacterium]
MKKFINYFLMLFLLPVMIISVASCGGDDDDDDDSDSDDLIGIWTVSDAALEITIDGEDFIQWFIDNLGITEAEAEVELEDFSFDVTGTITFNADGTYSSNFSGDSESGTWALVGSTLTLTEAGETSGDQLQVVSLNSSTLVLGFDESDFDDFDDDGTDEALVISLELTFTK